MMTTISHFLCFAYMLPWLPHCLSLSKELTGIEKQNVATTFPPPDLVFNWDECGVTKGCFRSPAECSPLDCDVIVSWEESEEYVRFELNMLLDNPGSHWIALGISDTANMGGASVIACLQPVINRRAESSFNSGIINTPLNNDTLGIVEGSFISLVIDGRSVCKFARWKALPPGTPEGELVYNISSPLEYHFLLANGPLSNTGQKLDHQQRPVTTQTKINVGRIEDLGGALMPAKIKAHATLMLAAWIICSGIGILNARYFKSAWSTKEICGMKLWFMVHQVCMSFVMILTLSGFIVIFVHVGGYSNLGSVTSSFLQSHPVLGIIIMICVLINPVMAMFRPSPDAPKRPIFKWGHRIVGEAGRIFAVVNLMTGLRLPASSSIVEDWMFWTMVGAICLHVIIECVLGILMYMKRRQEQDSTDQEMINLGSGGKWEAEIQTYTLETALLIIYATFVISLTLAMVVRIAIA